MKKLLSVLLALTMVLSLVCMVRPTAAHAASYAELEEIKGKKADLEDQINQVKSDKKKVLQQKRLMDQRNEVLQDEIDLVTSKIHDTTERISENEAQEKEQYQLFCRQVRQAEERGSVSYWSVLFKATSFADLLSRVDFINEVADYDQGVIDNLRTLREQLAQDKASLETDKEELDSAQAELKQQIAEAETLVAEYVATEEGLQAMYEAEDAAYDRVQAELRARANSSSNSSSSSSSNSGSNSSSSSGGGNYSSGSGGYIWPTNDTRLITSPVGGRASPGGIGSTNHKGVDIGASYGSEVLASKGGTVIVSDYDDYGYGNYVVIQHGGSGDYTLYGHMCTRYVREGDSVSQGQVIGLCGSTGASTGPHIHFEIHENYALKNPLDYLPGYIPCW